MVTQLNAATRLKASAWWDSLSKEQKQGYIEEHPDSKYAKDARGESSDVTPPDAKPESKTPKETSPAGAVVPKKKGFFKLKPISEALKKAFSRAPKEDADFYASGGHQAGSPQRRKASKIIKDKSVGILDHLKMQKDEWKAGFNAVRKLSSKQELTHHDKEALKACAKDLVYTVAATALTGGLAHGVVTAVAHMGMHIFTDMSLKAFSNSVVTASAEGSPSQEKMMANLVSQMADMFENTEIPDDVLEKAIDFGSSIK